MTGLCDCDCHKDSATTVVCRCDCTSDAPPERMADRPGEADAAAIRRAGDALRWHEQNYIASKMEAEFARLNARLSDYEQALRRDAATFGEFAIALEMLGRPTMAEAARIAQAGVRAALSGGAGPRE